MTNDTSKAPERIWAFNASEIEQDNPQCTIVAGEKFMHGAQEYVRVDLFDAMQARAEKAEATLERISQYPIPRPYFGKGVEIPDAMRGIARAALERKEET